MPYPVTIANRQFTRYDVCSSFALPPTRTADTGWFFRSLGRFHLSIEQLSESRLSLKAINLAMWSGPRNISTAMMRSWENRPDTQVIDEPFYAHYLEHTGIVHPMREEIIASQETDWKKIATELGSPGNASHALRYQKHITTHMLPHMDLEWAANIHHCFLIRDPALVVASYAKKRADVSAPDLGFEEQLNVYRKVCAVAADNQTSDNGNSTKQPLVIDSDAFLRNPEIHLRAICEQLELEFVDAMLSWPAGKRASDGIWGQHWYDAVEQSTCFGKPKTLDTRLSKDQQRVADECRSAYQAMAENALHL